MESMVNRGIVCFVGDPDYPCLPQTRTTPYEHGKAEYFSSGFEEVLIFVAALVNIATAAHCFFAPQPLGIGLGLGFSLLSLLPLLFPIFAKRSEE